MRSLQMFWIRYRFYGVVIWSMGSYFQPDSGRCDTSAVQGGMEGCYACPPGGISRCPVTMAWGIRSLLYTLSPQKNQRHKWCHCLTESFPAGTDESGIFSQHFQPTYFIVKVIVYPKIVFIYSLPCCFWLVL